MTDKNTSKLLELIKPEVDFDISNTPQNQIIQILRIGQRYQILTVNSFMFLTNHLLLIKTIMKLMFFYIHPTGFYEKNWNSDMDKNKSAYERTEIMLGNQASVFNESCNIYAPEYRQATYYSFFDIKNNGRSALDLAYSDIESAFKFFIENLNEDKPFIIAAHSQGALHAHRLINKMVDNTDLNTKLVCAYVIGYIIPEKYYSDLFPNTKKSSSFNETGCIVSWSSVVEGFKRNREKNSFFGRQKVGVLN